MKIKLDIKDGIADTLFIPLYGKAVETRKKNPLIQDATAVKLVDTIDYDFSNYKNKKGSSVGNALRASHYDRIAAQFIESHQNPIVVILGCGLDARWQRMGKIAAKGLFYELDIPEVIALREKLLPPEANQIFIAQSMYETEWMDELKAKHPNGDFIFIIEGVLMYFSENENRAFFNELVKRFSGAEVHFDLPNKLMSRHSDKHDTVGKSKARFKFGIDDEKTLEAWNPKLKHQRTWLFKDFKGWRRMGFVITLMMTVFPVMKKSFRQFYYKIES